MAPNLWDILYTGYWYIIAYLFSVTYEVFIYFPQIIMCCSENVFVSLNE
jgi:hypothetical protein